MFSYSNEIIQKMREDFRIVIVKHRDSCIDGSNFIFSCYYEYLAKENMVGGMKYPLFESDIVFEIFNTNPYEIAHYYNNGTHIIFFMHGI